MPSGANPKKQLVVRKDQLLLNLITLKHLNFNQQQYSDLVYIKVMNFKTNFVVCEAKRFKNSYIGIPSVVEK